MTQSRFTNFSLLPGGVESQLDSLNAILEYVSPNGCDASDLVQHFCKTWDVSTNRANNGLRFLLQTKVLERDVSAGMMRWGPAGEEWVASSPDNFADRNHGGLILNIHQRIRFVMEMLELLREPHSKSALTHKARAYFRGSLIAEIKVYERESWFRSAGLVRRSGGLLSLTQEGLALLDAGGFELAAPPVADDEDEPPAVVTPAVQPTPVKPAPSREPAPSQDPAPVAPAAPEPAATTSNSAQAAVLATEIREAASDSSNSRRLEQALDKAFTFLGFDTEWLSGAGKTDVLAKARLVDAEGSQHAKQPWSSYSVAIDAKSSRERLHPGHVDFLTLDEHKELHEADYSLVVGPDPKDRRMFRRATNRGIAFLSTDDMATVVEAHGRAPLTLIDYRKLVDQPGQVDIGPLLEESGKVERSWEIAHLACEALLEAAQTMRPVTASEVWIAVRGASGDRFQDHVSEEEVEAAVEMLSGRLVGALIVTTEDDQSPRYTLAMPPVVVRRKLEQLSRRIAPS